MPHCREAKGSVIGEESVMMILPVPNSQHFEPYELDQMRRSTGKHQRAQSYDAAVARPTLSAQSQQSPIWTTSSMSAAHVSPPVQVMFNTMRGDTEEPPSQRRRFSAEVTTAPTSSTVARSCVHSLSEAESCSQFASDVISSGHNVEDELTWLGDDLLLDGMDLPSPVAGGVATEDLYRVIKTEVPSSPCRAQGLVVDNDGHEMLDFVSDNRVIWGC